VKLNEYFIENKNFNKKYRFAIISDLHGSDVSGALERLVAARPDAIFAAGDIFERLDGSRQTKNEMGFLLLREAAAIAPTFYALGNHEIGGAHSYLPRRAYGAPISEENRARILETGVTFLENDFVLFDGIAVGGLTSGSINEGREPSLSWLDGFCASDEPKVLICHHPEYYEKYLASKNIDLIVSGHAHGGQWRFFGRGVFAPGQGLFPRYTSGVYDNRLVVSRGLKKGRVIPRLFNPTEVVVVSLR